MPPVQRPGECFIDSLGGEGVIAESDSERASQSISVSGVDRCKVSNEHARPVSLIHDQMPVTRHVHDSSTPRSPERFPQI